MRASEIKFTKGEATLDLGEGPEAVSENTIEVKPC